MTREMNSATDRGGGERAARRTRRRATTAMITTPTGYVMADAESQPPNAPVAPGHCASQLPAITTPRASEMLALTSMVRSATSRKPVTVDHHAEWPTVRSPAVSANDGTVMAATAASACRPLRSATRVGASRMNCGRTRAAAVTNPGASHGGSLPVEQRHHEPSAVAPVHHGDDRHGSDADHDQRHHQERRAPALPRKPKVRHRNGHQQQGDEGVEGAAGPETGAQQQIGHHMGKLAHRRAERVVDQRWVGQVRMPGGVGGRQAEVVRAVSTWPVQSPK